MSWGIELWDRYEDLCNHTKDGIDFLENKIGDFVKERGNIERKYASELRALVKKYTPKNSVKTSDNKADNGNKKSGPASIVLQNVSADEEYSHVQAYKEVRFKKVKLVISNGLVNERFCVWDLVRYQNKRIQYQ